MEWESLSLWSTIALYTLSSKTLYYIFWDKCGSSVDNLQEALQDVIAWCRWQCARLSPSDALFWLAHLVGYEELGPSFHDPLCGPPFFDAMNRQSECTRAIIDVRKPPEKKWRRFQASLERVETVAHCKSKPAHHMRHIKSRQLLRLRYEFRKAIR